MPRNLLTKSGVVLPRNNLLTKPFWLFCSCKTIGFKRIFADNNVVKDVYPPKPTITLGLSLIKIKNILKKCEVLVPNGTIWGAFGIIC